MRIEIGRSVARPEALGVPLKAVQIDGRHPGVPVLELVIGNPRSDGPCHAGAPVADVGAHPPTPFGRQPKPRTKILSVIDSSPVRGLGPYEPSAQPALASAGRTSPGADLSSAPGSVSATCANNRFRMMNLSGHNIPKASTFAFTTRTVGARWERVMLVGESVCPRGRDQDNPLPVRDNDPERQDLSPELRSAPRAPADAAHWELVTTSPIEPQMGTMKEAPVFFARLHFESRSVATRAGAMSRRRRTRRRAQGIASQHARGCRDGLG